MESASIFESVNGCEDEDFAEVALPLAEELVNQLLSSTKV